MFKKKLTFLPRDLHLKLVNRLKQKITNFQTQDNYIRSYSIASYDENTNTESFVNRDGSTTQQELTIQDAEEVLPKGPRKVKSQISLSQTKGQLKKSGIFQTQERAKPTVASRNSFDNDPNFSVDNIVESIIQNSSVQRSPEFSSRQTRLSMESQVSFRKIPDSQDNKDDTLERNYQGRPFSSGSAGENEPTLPNSLHDNLKSQTNTLLNHPPIMTLLKNVLKNDREIMRFYRRNADHLRNFLDSQKDFYYNEIVKKTYLNEKLCKACHEKINLDTQSASKHTTHTNKGHESLLNSTLKSQTFRIENNLAYMSTHFLNESTKKYVDAGNDPKTPSLQTINLNNNTTNITNLYVTSSSRNNSFQTTPPSGSKHLFKKKYKEFKEDKNPVNSVSSSYKEKQARLYKKRRFTIDNNARFHSVQKQKLDPLQRQNMPYANKNKSKSPIKLYKKNSTLGTKSNRSLLLLQKKADESKEIRKAQEPRELQRHFPRRIRRLHSFERLLLQQKRKQGSPHSHRLAHHASLRPAARDQVGPREQAQVPDHEGERLQVQAQGRCSLSLTSFPD